MHVQTSCVRAGFGYSSILRFSNRSVIVAFMVFATAMGPGLTGFLIDLGVPYPAQIMAMGLYCIAAAVMLTLVSRRLAARTRSGLDLAASQG